MLTYLQFILLFNEIWKILENTVTTGVNIDSFDLELSH